MVRNSSTDCCRTWCLPSTHLTVPQDQHPHRACNHSLCPAPGLPTTCPAENSTSGQMQVHRAGSSRCSSWMELISLAGRKKGTQEEQAKVMATAGPEQREPPPHRTPSTKSFVPTRSQMPQFFHQFLRAGNLSTFIIPCFTACFGNSRLSPSHPSSAPPALISTCALHSPHSSRHLNQLPPICCPPQFQHPGPTLVLPLPHQGRVSVLTLHFLVIHRFANKQATL